MIIAYHLDNTRMSIVDNSQIPVTDNTANIHQWRKHKSTLTSAALTNIICLHLIENGVCKNLEIWNFDTQKKSTLQDHLLPPPSSLLHCSSSWWSSSCLLAIKSGFVILNYVTKTDVGIFLYLILGSRLQPRHSH